MGYLTFISHSGEDSWIARKLSVECEAVGADTFLDEAQIAVGAKFEDDILSALKKADELLVLITPWALKRPYVWLEIGAAWFKGIPIIVLLLGVSTAEFQKKANIPVALKERNLLPLNNVDRYFNELSGRTNGKEKGK
ncbi:MAG: toll/interleukin-1 receptor domain-containing protein [Methylosarcina sp.]